MSASPSPPTAHVDQLNFSLRQRLPVILQNEVSECALACLAMICTFHGRNISLPELRRRFSVSISGSSIISIEEIARKSGLTSRSLRLELNEISQLRRPAILHWRIDHFVVLRGIRRRGISIHDPALGRRFIRWHDASKYFSGVAIELHPAGDFEKKAKKPGVRIWDL